VDRELDPVDVVASCSSLQDPDRGDDRSFCCRATTGGLNAPNNMAENDKASRFLKSILNDTQQCWSVRRED
jgi:hypothetical protein